MLFADRSINWYRHLKGLLAVSIKMKKKECNRFSVLDKVWIKLENYFLTIILRSYLKFEISNCSETSSVPAHIFCFLHPSPPALQHSIPTYPPVTPSFVHICCGLPLSYAPQT